MKAGYVYIMANRKYGTIYIGVTSDLIARVYQHREGLVPGFTKRYGCKLLVWYEAFDDLQRARQRDRTVARDVGLRRRVQHEGRQAAVEVDHDLSGWRLLGQRKIAAQGQRNVAARHCELLEVEPMVCVAYR